MTSLGVKRAATTIRSRSSSSMKPPSSEPERDLRAISQRALPRVALSVRVSSHGTPLAGARRDPRINVGLTPDPCVRAKHEAGWKAFFGDPASERYVVGDDPAIFEIAKAKQDSGHLGVPFLSGD